MSTVMVAPEIEACESIDTPRPTTTLFDLIAALQDTADRGDDHAVVVSVVDLLKDGRIRFQTPVDVGNHRFDVW
ncbi:hypothetical protein C2W62_24870 [Candidatus Entotheonella serta]|nr:hypothetical protein C2W62_24870 [Candidatus Entotheonella serta]